MQTLCRGCGFRSSVDMEACGPCGLAHIMRHAKLHDLVIAHPDCDALYAVIEKRDRPELRDVPAIVRKRCR